MRISDWSSDVCSSDLPPYRDARIVAQQVDRAVVAVYTIGDRRHLIWPGDVELDGRPVQFLGHRLSRLQFDVGNGDMHTGTRQGQPKAAPGATDTPCTAGKRKRVVAGKSVSGRWDLGDSRLKKK